LCKRTGKKSVPARRGSRNEREKNEQREKTTLTTQKNSIFFLLFYNLLFSIILDHLDLLPAQARALVEARVGLRAVEDRLVCPGLLRRVEGGDDDAGGRGWGGRERERERERERR